MNKDISSPIGIIGAGHLGLSLAQAFKNSGFDLSKLMISYRGSKETLARIENAGLETCISDNTEIFEKADVILLTISPYDVSQFDNRKVKDSTIIISCIAGWTTQKLEEKFNHSVCRIIPSSPVSILDGMGICGVFPLSEKVEAVLSSIHLKVFPLSSDDLFPVFTAIMCLPAAFLQLDINKQPYTTDKLILEYRAKLPYIEDLLKWAQDITPYSLTKEEKEQYIAKMATKGGVTEAIVNAIKENDILETAFSKGIEKCYELSKM